VTRVGSSGDFRRAWPAAAVQSAIGRRGERHSRAARKQRWRALLLCIEAKLESVVSGIETFAEAFPARVVMADNRTVYEHTASRIAPIAKGWEMQPLWPAPTGAKP
jgi:hypothetical protein